MSDIRLNFSSQWPSIQVVKVIPPSEFGPDNKVEHGLEFPPLVLAISPVNPDSFYGMRAISVDDKYIYRREPGIATDAFVVYNIDISTGVDYPVYDEMEGEVPDGVAHNDIDLRKFLLHSRAVSPMVLSVVVHNFTQPNEEFEYTHQLDYPVFQFGHQRMTAAGASIPQFGLPEGAWMALNFGQAQAWPFFYGDGFSMGTSTLDMGNGNLTDKVSFTLLRNPAIVTRNTVSVVI